VFIADRGNDRVVVARPKKVIDDPEGHWGWLMSSGFAEDPVNTAFGFFTDEFSDMAAHSGLFGLELTRAYNSSDPNGSGEMGP